MTKSFVDDYFFGFELARRKEASMIFGGGSSECFNQSIYDELYEEALELGYTTPMISAPTPFEEAVERLVKECEINKPQEVSILLASALLANNEEQDKTSLSRMYQIWFQDCHSMFIEKYKMDKPEYSAAPALIKKAA